ncbi:hypothetical protein OH460_07850 [Vibrio sp. Makdt]|uniref:hypothetical protein n=1 Tax=Vibrio sp. Makdt TaxID=2998828 RepID=UPI0022CD7730|nr:hypothetical protein [Vibrio sp. Makdt]MDA0152210.1 hypothetical protein [Vibrio sp. Makdt]
MSTVFKHKVRFSQLFKLLGIICLLTPLAFALIGEWPETYDNDIMPVFAHIYFLYGIQIIGIAFFASFLWLAQQSK